MVWQPHFAVLMQIEKQLHEIDDHQFVESVRQVVKRIQSLIDSGTTPFSRIEVETSDEWRALFGQEVDESCAEALLWLEELLPQL